ncbi:MAG: imidazole glycerol phosphate synthase subunit HisH [Coriobacteriales bacterium]|nr:imidazole glycerol phosphate synthase subunit HisH [Actinomycetes bacterium]
MIAIVDYKMGNLRSVQKAFEHVGARDVVVSDDPLVVGQADGIVLPGVGAFRDASENLKTSGMWDVLDKRVAEGTPLLGICLGMQLLATTGREDGEWEGLDIIPGTCDRLAGGLKLPHIGWNTVEYTRSSRLFEGIPDGSAFYFVHSYRLVPIDESSIIGRTEYGVPFASVVQSGSTYAVQFHPEKSSAAGLRLLANFSDIVNDRGER